MATSRLPCVYFPHAFFSLANYLFKLFAHLKKIGFFSFCYVVRAFSSKYESSVGYMVCRYFPQFAACLFTQGLLQSNHFSFLMKSSLTMFSFSGLCFFASYLLTLHRTWRHSDVLLCFLLEVVALRFDLLGVHSFLRSMWSTVRGSSPCTCLCSWFGSLSRGCSFPTELLVYLWRSPLAVRGSHGMWDVVPHWGLWISFTDTARASSL